MKQTLSYATLLVLAASANAQSLWDSTFRGYVSDPGALSVGSTVVVVIDVDTSLAYEAARVESNSITVELSGGGKGLLDFLPAGTSQATSRVSGDSGVEFAASLSAIVVAIDQSGSMLLEGGRTIEVGGRSESIKLNGIIDPSVVGEERRVNASSIADLRISFTTLLQSDTPILAVEDLVRELSQPDTSAALLATSEVPASADGLSAGGLTPSGEPGATDELTETDGLVPTATADAGTESQPETTGAATEGAVGGAAATTDPAIESSEELPVPTLSVSQERQDELLLLVVNRLIDLIRSGQ